MLHHENAKVQRGRLLVLEGPDGVGKTGVVDGLLQKFRSSSIPTHTLAFPGRGDDNLGGLVYRIHHEKESLGITSGITNLALQTLHIAAHVDAIESVIIPKLQEGTTIVLDRFWWSTWVYGTLTGIAPPLLEHLIHTEKAVWGEHSPDHVILLDRAEPLRSDAADSWQARRTEYSRLAEREAEFYRVHRVQNDASLHNTVEHIWELLWPKSST